MMKSCNLKKDNGSKYLVIVLIIIFAIYIFFNFYASISDLSIKHKTELFDLGLINNEKALYGFSFPEHDKFGKLFRWAGKESELLISVGGKIMIIPVFNPKPDICDDPIHIKIYINGNEVLEFVQTGNELSNIEIEIDKLGFKKNDMINLKFICNKTWSPKDYGFSDDTRVISFALRGIYFID